MWKRVVARGTVPPAPDYVAEALALARSAAEPVDMIVVTFGIPESGWMALDISAANRSAIHWRLSNTSDPFLLHRSNGGPCFTFIDWLEHVANNEFPALVVDMEGPVGVLIVLPADDPENICLISFRDHSDAINLNIVIPRNALLSSFYRALVAHWESAAFGDNWQQWSRGTIKPRSIRSELIEARFASK